MSWFRAVLTAGFLLALQPAFAADSTLPDPILTPGAVTAATVEAVCRKGYTAGLDDAGAKVRNVPRVLRRTVFRAYGVAEEDRRDYELDHLIALELGGSNDRLNLWPESRLTEPWNADVKDRLENRLHRLVCRGEIRLEEAQREIATDWVAAFRKYIAPLPDSRRHRRG